MPVRKHVQNAMILAAKGVQKFVENVPTLAVKLVAAKILNMK
jgi:hypothetical protein